MYSRSRFCPQKSPTDIFISDIINFNFDIIFSFLSEGGKHDAGMLADSGLMQDLERYAFSPTGDPMALYGDPAYPLRVHLIVPYRAAGIRRQMEEFNKCMSTVRVSVEWLFGDIINFFKQWMAYEERMP